MEEELVNEIWPNKFRRKTEFKAVGMPIVRPEKVVRAEFEFRFPF